MIKHASHHPRTVLRVHLHLLHFMNFKRNIGCIVTLAFRYKKLLDRMYSPENEKVNYVRYQASDTAHLSLLPPK